MPTKRYTPDELREWASYETIEYMDRPDGADPRTAPELLEALIALEQALRWHFVPLVERYVGQPSAHAKDADIEAARAAIKAAKEGWW